MTGLPEDVLLCRGDRLRAVSADEPAGRCPRRSWTSSSTRAPWTCWRPPTEPTCAAVELGARVGRRTGELCGLRYECLGYDEVLDKAGQLRAAPVLIHDMPKVAIKSYRLPIDPKKAALRSGRICARRGVLPHYQDYQIMTRRVTDADVAVAPDRSEGDTDRRRLLASGLRFPARGSGASASSTTIA